MGRLLDIYFGSNKGKNWENYGFIRFIRVSDIKALESKLNGVACRNNNLEINVARHGQKTPPLPPNKINKNSRTTVPRDKTLKSMEVDLLIIEPMLKLLVATT
ncbi:unnamed protein product [Lactuca saligna]|uniref:RRM domain-containing protein n=1 Tax=Lactuca saligna TaxID=75948 RepID=A0AA36EED9_LACSI|nr:unnamed protein product [Lactuca saligna]